MAGELGGQGLHDALVILGAAGVVIPAFARIRISPVIGFILVGAAVGPAGPTTTEPSDCASRWRSPRCGDRGPPRGMLRSKNSRNIGGRPSRSGIWLAATPRSGSFCVVLMFTTAGDACSTRVVKSGSASAWTLAIWPSISTAANSERKGLKRGIDIRLPFVTSVVEQ